MWTYMDGRDMHFPADTPSSDKTHQTPTLQAQSGTISGPVLTKHKYPFFNSKFHGNFKVSRIPTLIPSVTLTLQVCLGRYPSITHSSSDSRYMEDDSTVTQNGGQHSRITLSQTKASIDAAKTDRGESVAPQTHKNPWNCQR